MSVDCRSVEAARRGRRGFSLVVVLLLTGVMGVTALLVFQSLAEDARLASLEKRMREARAAAEGGLMESLNDARVIERLPEKAGGKSRIQLTGPSKSMFAEDETVSASYEADLTLVRTAPMLESSQRRVRAVLYEVRVHGETSTGESADVEALIYRVGVAPRVTAAAEVYGR